ncbi:MAG TPA: hypothetical protein VKF82_11455 [Candidatus Eremiobacteraceae bacterium]|nr:hypothetical protein [Candidatus Eremiobacteraceae bacterium]
MSRLTYRVWFCGVVAIIAAGLANPGIEFASNAGWFGRGDFTDRSNLDVIPTIVLGIALAALVILGRIWQLAAAGNAKRLAAWLRLSGHVLHPCTIARFIPAVFGIQMLVLFSMESIEQIAVRGHLLGGSLWLGGPLAVSLFLHALFCVATAYVLTRALHGFAHRAARIAYLLQTILSAAGVGARMLPRMLGGWLPSSSPLHSGIGERAPPSPSY